MMNYELLNNNRVELCGEIVQKLAFSHEIFNEGFYETVLKVPRLSDHCDLIPITISERLLAQKDLRLGSKVCLKGQFRSYNKLENEKSRLMLSVFVREICDVGEVTNPNLIEISGYLCKKPNYRTTPFNREICDLLLAVNRSYNKSDYIPCIAWGRNARFVQNAQVGDKIFISGRIQSRDYEKKLDDGSVLNKTAYEVSINKIGLESVAEKLINENIDFEEGNFKIN